MAQEYDYDPYEERRRRLLPIGWTYGETETELPEEEEPWGGEEEPAEGADVEKRLPSMAEERYRNLLRNAPTPEQYKPSKLRRVLAGIAAGATTYNEGSQRGLQAGMDIRNRPYQRAAMDYMAQLGPAEKEFQLQKTLEAEDVARRRVGAYERSAAAREASARATEAWRRRQEENLPWVPRTEEEAIRLKAAGQRPATPPKKTEFELFMENPKQYTDYWNARNTGKGSNRRPLDEEMKLIEFRERQKARFRKPDQPKTETPRPVSPSQQVTAEDLALMHVLRQNPEYEDFTKEVDGPAGRKVLKPKMQGELSKIGLFDRRVDPRVLAKYNAFLGAIDEQKRRIIGTKTGGEGNRYEGERVE